VCDATERNSPGQGWQQLYLDPDNHFTAFPGAVTRWVTELSWDQSYQEEKMMQKRRWIRLLFFGLGIILLLAGISLVLRRYPINDSVVAVGLTTTAGKNQSAATVTPENPGSQPMTWATNDALLLSELETSAPTKAAWILEGTRLAPIRAITATAQALSQALLPMSTGVPYSEYPGIPQRQAGMGIIVEGVKTPYYYLNVTTFNSWIKKETDRYILVMAGQDYGNELHPVNEVLVEERSLGGNHALIDNLSNSYPLPIQNPADSPIYIVDAVGEKVFLRGKSGSAFAFNVATRKFVSVDRPLPLERSVGQGMIVEDGQVPFIRPSYYGWSRWFIQRGDQTITVYAGADIEDRMKDLGGIYNKPLFAVVISRGEPTANDSVDFYPVPAPPGGSEIDRIGIPRMLAVEGDQVLFSGVYGYGVFDLSTRSYLSYARSYPGFDFGPFFDDDLPATPTPAAISSPATP
jgi:hypothetical protein